jgi:hypothetical protein
MITLRLSGHETDANHFREEGRHPYLDQRGRLYNWRDDFRALNAGQARCSEPARCRSQSRFFRRGDGICRHRRLSGDLLGCKHPAVVTQSMSDEEDWDFTGDEDAKTTIRAAIRYLLKGAAGGARGDIVQEIITIVREVANETPSGQPDPLDDGMPGG